MKPRLAIEIAEKNFDNTWTVFMTSYFDIENTDEILHFIETYHGKSTIRINRFFYANNYGIEIDFTKKES